MKIISAEYNESVTHVVYYLQELLMQRSVHV